MTDKEIAEEYVDTLLNKDDAEFDKFLDENLGDLKLTKKQAGTLLGIIKGIGISSFLAGLKIGKDMNVPIKWHDLRKDPNDLPKRNNELTDRSDVIITDKGIAHYNFRKQKWYVHNFECDMSFSETIIAWCEIPKYTEE